MAADVNQDIPIEAEPESVEMTPPPVVIEDSAEIEDDSHLTILDEDKKWEIIREWQDKMKTSRLCLVVCAACSRRVSHCDSEWIDGNTVDLTLLTNSCLPDNVLPTSYNLQAYGKAILNSKGLQSVDSVSYMRLCRKCFDALSAGRMPKFALCNWLYFGTEALPDEVKQCFQQSTLFDKMLISRARANSVTCRFNMRKTEDSGGVDQSVLNRERKGVRGNVMVAPLDVVRMNKVIPPASDSIRDTMCAIFVGDKLPSRSSILNYHPVLVRKSRVKTMISFLLSNNVHYKPTEEFAFSESNLNALFPETQVGASESIPSAVHIGYIPMNDAINSSTSDYTYRNVDGDSDGHDDEILMENVGYTDGDHSPTSYQAMKAVAMERCLQGKPFLVSGRGTQLIPDFNNPAILTWLFPHLDPWGIGGFSHPNRTIRISMQEQLSHLLLVDDSPFQKDAEFAFVFYNVCRKATVAQSLRFLVPRQQQRRIVEDLLKVNPDVLRKLQEECQENAQYKPVDDEERLAFKLLTSLRLIARHVPGSDGYKVMRRNEIRAVIAYRGAPTLFVTLNPSDVDNPIVRLLAGEDIDLEDMSSGVVMSEWKRKLFTSSCHLNHKV